MTANGITFILICVCTVHPLAFTTNKTDVSHEIRIPTVSFYFISFRCGNNFSISRNYIYKWIFSVFASVSRCVFFVFLMPFIFRYGLINNAHRASGKTDYFYQIFVENVERKFTFCLLAFDHQIAFKVFFLFRHDIREV